MKPLLDLLAAEGYVVAFRENGWCECLLVREAERWIGVGLTGDSALDNAIRHACPSNLARSLVVRALDAQTAAPGNDVAPDDPTAPDLIPEQPLTREMPGEPSEAHPIVPGPEEDEGADACEQAVAPRAELAAVDVRSDLEHLVHEIDATEEELGLCAPKRQRLVLLMWAARARAAQDSVPELSGLVGNITRKLGGLGKAWWPGTVPALVRTARPEDTGSLVRVPQGSTWPDVANLVEAALAALEDGDLPAGRDAHGWADAAATVPAPDDPDARLAALAEEVAKADPLGMPPSSGAAAPSETEMLDAVRKLRWLRRHATNARLWAQVAGRVRWWCAERGGYRQASVELDPAFVPPGLWANAVLGAEAAEGLQRRRDEVSQARQREADLLLRRAPANESDDPRVVIAWLVEALPFTDTAHDAVVEALTPFRDVVLGIQGTELPELTRRLRRRLRLVQEALDDPRKRAFAESVTNTRDHDTERDLPALPADLLSFTSGLRAVFVSNRQDEELQTRLATMFDFSEMRLVEADPRRLDALAEAVAAGGVDFVLFASGFTRHASDIRVKRACDAAGVSFVRVNKGRPAACARAVARAVGLAVGRSTAA